MLEILISLYLNNFSQSPRLNQSNFPNTTINTITSNSNQYNTKVPTQLNSTRPNLQSKASLVYDINSDTILFSENPNTKLPIASLTKLMTAYIIIQEHSLDEIVTVPLEATTIGGSTMNLRAGERISIENLLKGLIINSGNDAAVTLAIHNSQNVEKFVQKMNQFAQNLNMKNSRFQNPMGYDSDNNYSTVYDLLILSKQVISNPFLHEIGNIKTITITSADGKFTHNLRNTNLELQNFQGINGFKTGTTNIAGQCLITTTEDPNPKIAIFLGSQNRFLDTKTMLHWTQTNFKH